MTLGAYIQVPFCQTKCTYCNFHTGVVARDKYQPYAAAVCREIAAAASSADLAALRGATIDTVYFGGGTPSLLEPSALANILDSLRASFGLATHPALASAAEPEITLEADPETITPEKAQAWRAAGFNRISLGAQSFDDRELQAAGRMHRRADIFAAAQILREAGLRNISMDLIAGLAHQTRESWSESVARILDIRPEHISIYMLEIDEGSHLGSESLAGGSRYSAKAIPSDDAMAEYYDAACMRLAAAGYEHYEISNWGLPGFRSRHNLKYWRRDPYIGFGAGAHSFDGARRWSNVHDSAKYVGCIEQGISPREHIEPVTQQEALEEELFLGLRQLEGIDLAQLECRYNVNLRERVAPLRRDGLVELQGTQLRLAADRLTVSNEVFVELLGQGVERA
ncbi:MAG: radical SAM family heme chaperone HemW [Candidatus Acidiferrales bacterium]